MDYGTTGWKFHHSGNVYSSYPVSEMCIVVGAQLCSSYPFERDQYNSSHNTFLISQSILTAFFLSYTQTNTFQGILITNGFQSYTVFTYRCLLIQWSGNAVIGFRATGNFNENHAISGGDSSNVSCLNTLKSSWTNIIYPLRKFQILICACRPHTSDQLVHNKECKRARLACTINDMSILMRECAI